MKAVDFKIIDIGTIKFAPEILMVNKLANPYALLKNKESDFNFDNVEFLLLTLPIVGYIEGDTFYLISGVFTFNTIVQVNQGKNLNIQVTCLREKPISKNVKKTYLTYLTQLLINQFFITDPNFIGRLLSCWFKKDKGAKSIFGSKSWLDYFPNLCTKNKVAKHLSISQKNL